MLRVLSLLAVFLVPALAAGQPVFLPNITSIARTLGAPSVSTFTLEHTRRLVREVVVVPDRAALDALVFLAERAKIVTEAAASWYCRSIPDWQARVIGTITLLFVQTSSSCMKLFVCMGFSDMGMSLSGKR